MKIWISLSLLKSSTASLVDSCLCSKCFAFAGGVDQSNPCVRNGIVRTSVNKDWTWKTRQYSDRVQVRTCCPGTTCQKTCFQMTQPSFSRVESFWNCSERSHWVPCIRYITLVVGTNQSLARDRNTNKEPQTLWWLFWKQGFCPQEMECGLSPCFLAYAA